MNNTKILVGFLIIAGVYVAFTIIMMVVYRVKNGSIFNIFIRGNKLLIEKSLLPKVNQLGQRLILFVFGVYVIWLKNYPNDIDSTLIFFFLFFFLMAVWSIYQFIVDRNVLIKVVDDGNLLINNNVIFASTNIKIRTKKHVSSQGSVSYSLSLDTENKTFKFLDGVDKVDLEYARSTVSEFLSQAGVSPTYVEGSCFWLTIKELILAIQFPSTNQNKE